MIPKPLSEEAFNLLDAALLGSGPSFGLLVVSNPASGEMFVRAGDDERQLHGDDANVYMEAFRELLELGMLAASASDGNPLEWTVTTLGRNAVWQPG